MGSITYVNGLAGLRGTSDDVVGNRENDNPLDISKLVNEPSTMDGEQVLGGLVIRRFTHCPMYLTLNTEAPDPSGYFAPHDVMSELPRAIAMMNPSQPAMLLPAALGELRDFPSMLAQVPDLIKGWGRHLVKPPSKQKSKAVATLQKVFRDAGAVHLGVQFGWSPFLRDLASLLGFQLELVKRLEWLLRLAAGETIKRRVVLLPKRALVEKGVVTTQSTTSVVTQNRVEVYNLRHWLTTRWSPLFPMMYRGRCARDLLDLARAMTLGYGAWGLLESWWELLPWSWLTDWFVNVGRYLSLMNNGMLLKLDSCCYCKTTMVDVYFSVVSKPDWLTISGRDYLYRCRKERQVLTGSVDPFKPSTPSLPALTGGQLGILGALFASRT